MSHISHEKTCLTPYANNISADQPARLRSRIGAFVIRCIDSTMVVPVLVDLRFYVQIKSKQKLESKILQVDGEEKIHHKYSDSKIIYVRSPAGGKISWYFHRSYGLTAGDADPPFFEKIYFFAISGTFGSFWDVADHYNYMRFY